MLKLLIVDDEKMPREILVNYIDWESMNVTTIEEADDGLSALAKALELKPDIIISDIKMPRMNGIELASEVRIHFPNCKFIFLSGYSDKEYLKSAIKLKAVSYIEKPIDLEEITELLRETTAECIEEKAGKSKDFIHIEQNLCLELIRSNADAATAYEKLSLIGKDISNDSKYVTALIKSNSDVSTNEQVLVILKKSLEPLLSKYIIGKKNDDYILVHFEVNNNSFTDNLKCTFETFIVEAKETLGENCKIFASLGQVVGTIDKLYTSYQSAVISLQKHFFRGYNRFITYTEDFITTYQFDESLIGSLIDQIKSGKKIEADLLIKRLVLEIKKHENTNHDSIRNVFYKIILSISRLAEDRNMHLFNNESNFILQTMSTANTLDEIEQYILQIISSIFCYLNKDADISIFERITNFITENLCSENLSVTFIAENLNLTSTYLCMVFKRDTGKTINQYITNLRIERAKEYLIETDIKLYAVARKVGYNDGKYFTKVFTKTLGISPKEYREIHCREKKNI